MALKVVEASSTLPETATSEALVAVLFRCLWKAIDMDAPQLIGLTCTIFEAVVAQVTVRQHRSIYTFLLAECDRETRRQHSRTRLSQTPGGLERGDVARGWAALKLLEVVQGSVTARAAGETRLRFVNILEVLLQLAGPLRTVRGFRQEFTLEDAIGSHACSLKLVHACDQWYSSRAFLPLTAWHC
jgi:hypothetical protein